jgi:hypothetical protein
MFKILKPFILFVLGFTALTGCKPDAVKKTIHFEVVSDSLYVGQNNYNINFAQWKKIYEECRRNRLFQNAFYMGLQENIHIGSISNQQATNINRQFSIFDTSNRKNIFNLIAFIKQSNCNTKINLSKDLQDDFYRELIKSLKNSGQYQYLANYIDTGKINFKITTLADNSISPDSLAGLMQRTNDSSLIRFREMLLTPGNALLVRTAMIFGFYCDFPLKKKLSLEEETKFKNEVFFKMGNTGDNGSIRLLPNQNLQIFINKYYTVFGQFYVFKEDK